MLAGALAQALVVAPRAFAAASALWLSGCSVDQRAVRLEAMPQDEADARQPQLVQPGQEPADPASSALPGAGGNGAASAAPAANGSPPAAAGAAGSGSQPLQPAAPGELRTLTLAGAGAGSFGRVRSTPPGLDCAAPPCSATFPLGSFVRLEAFSEPSAGDGFAGWSGACLGLDDCTLSMTGDARVTASYEAANRVFVTSVRSSGDMGGLAGADARCNELGRQLGLANELRAWLSTSSVNAIDRLQGSRGWVRVDGKAVADTPEALASGEVFHPIRIDEQGVDIGRSYLAYTGTGFDGLVFSGETCDDWTTSALTLGGVGDPNGISSAFTLRGSFLCSESHGLYCFEVGRNVRVSPAPAAGRLAFLATVVLADGLASADAQCQAQADALQRPGTFKALLASEGASAASRFDLSGAPWVTVAGVRIAATAADFFQADRWDTAPNQNLMGGWTSATVMAGGASLLSPGTREDTCASWTSTSGELAMVQGSSLASDPFGFFFGDETARTSCAQRTYGVLCLQE